MYIYIYILFSIFSKNKTKQNNNPRHIWALLGARCFIQRFDLFNGLQIQWGYLEKLFLLLFRFFFLKVDFLKIRAKWSMWSKMRVMSGPVSNKGVPIDVVNCFRSW